MNPGTAAIRACLSAPTAILLVGPLPPPSGGMANQTQQLARLLEADGWRVTVVRTNGPYRPTWIGRVHGVRALFRLIPYLVKLWRATRDADVVHVMANSGWAWHLFAAPAVWVARLRRRPSVVNYRGGEASKFLTRQSRWVLPSLARAAAVVVPSGFLQRAFAHYGVECEVVPNIVDLTRFTPRAERASRERVVVARNLEDIYDVPTALRAFARVRHHYVAAHLMIAGSGPARHALEALVAELRLTDAVTFTGRLDNERMAELYRDADIAINPSRVDNMPISLLEAMASGVPIVSTDVGGIPFLVENEKTALLVPAGDAAAMATAIRRLFDDRALADRLRAAGIEAAKKYAWSEVRPCLFAVYARALTAASPRRADTGRASTRGVH